MEHGHNGIEAAAAAQANYILESHQQSMQVVGPVAVHHSLHWQVAWDVMHIEDLWL